MTFHTIAISGPVDAPYRLVWGHGWGQSGAAFRPLAEALSPFAPSVLLDFPGFGKSPAPPQTWGTADYADAVSHWLSAEIASQPRSPEALIWIGHSFGGRVGVQLASRHPSALRGLVLIAAAGLPRQRSTFQQFQLQARRTVARTAGRLLSGAQLNRLRSRVGSADYRQAGSLRPILTRVVSENLSDVAARIACPALLIYGRNDTETPPEIGERYRTLIRNSELAVLDGFGHLDILNEGRHQVTVLLRRFLQSVTPVSVIHE